MATMFKTDQIPTLPNDQFDLPKDGLLEFLQAKVGGWIEFIHFPDGSAFVVDEEGRLKEKEENRMATILCLLKGRPQDLSIVGDAVFLSREEMLRWSSEPTEKTESVN